MNVPGLRAERHDWETLTPVAAFVVASWVVDRATEVTRVLEERLSWQEHRQLSLRTLLISKEMLGMLGRRGHHRQVRLALRSLPMSVQRHLNVVDAGGNIVTYRQVEKPMRQIAAILAEPTVLVDHDHPPADPETGEVIRCPVTCPFMAADHDWYMTAMAKAARPDDIPVALDMAMDWTDMETWAKPLFHFAPDAPEAPGDVGDDYHSEASVPKATEAKERPASSSKAADAQAPLGTDGRRVPTKDHDARWGHRFRRAGKSPHFVGWDCNTMIGAPGRNGEPRAPFLYGATLVPASSYAGDSAMKLLRLAAHFRIEVRDLIADRGFTRLDPDRFSRPAREMVDDIVLDLLEQQWRRRTDYTVIRDEGRANERAIRIKRIAGGFFTSGMPDSMDDLSRVPFTAPRAERMKRMAEFDHRAQYAFVPHGRTKAGTQRWAGPATSYAGFKVRCPNSPQSMRAPHTRPLTSCSPGEGCSCGEVVVIDDPSSVREQQRLLWGTTKWEKSYGRRTAVERAYADDKVQVTEFDRGSIYCFGTVKHALYYTPTIVARNIQVALRWYRDHDLADPWDIHRVSQPGYELPLEPHLAVVRSEDGSSSDGDDAEGEAERSLPAEAPVDTNQEEDAFPEPDAPGRQSNRAQRRAVARRGERAFRPSKPPKPPPRPQPPRAE